MSLSTGKCISLPLLFDLDAVLNIFILMARLTPAAKRKKDDTRAAKAQRPAVVATTPARKDGAALRTPMEGRLEGPSSGAACPCDQADS